MSLGELLRTKSSEYELLAEWHVAFERAGAGRVPVEFASRLGRPLVLLFAKRACVRPA
jgi:hypothetical protein